MAELKEKCKKLGIKGYSKLRKEELEQACTKGFALVQKKFKKRSSSGKKKSTKKKRSSYNKKSLKKRGSNKKKSVRKSSKKRSNKKKSLKKKRSSSGKKKSKVEEEDEDDIIDWDIGWNKRVDERERKKRGSSREKDLTDSFHQLPEIKQAFHDVKFKKIGGKPVVIVYARKGKYPHALGYEMFDDVRIEKKDIYDDGEGQVKLTFRKATAAEKKKVAYKNRIKAEYKNKAGKKVVVNDVPGSIGMDNQIDWIIAGKAISYSNVK